MRAEIEREQEAAIEEEIELRRQIQSTTEQRDTLRKQVVGLEVFSRIFPYDILGLAKKISIYVTPDFDRFCSSIPDRDFRPPKYHTEKIEKTSNPSRWKTSSRSASIRRMRRRPC